MPPKTGFSRTRNVAYEDEDTYDDDDEYFEEADETGDMTADDKEQMRSGTIRVREALGEMSAFVTDTQIQEALWHYYYDVGKSVSYLKNRLGTNTKQETPRKEKTMSRFDHAAKSADLKAPHTTGKQTHTQHSSVKESAYPVAHRKSPAPASVYICHTHQNDFFWDVPWNAVPLDRLGDITVDPPLYKARLLGGSSKLAALAAKRRKEREEMSKAQMSKSNGDAGAAVAMLDQLSMQSKHKTPASLSDERIETERSIRVSRYPVRRRSPSQSSHEEDQEEEAPKHTLARPTIVVDRPAQRASASSFASTLCGSDRAVVQPGHELNTFPVPYTQHKDHNSLKAFIELSPDDVVRAAQAKSAGGGQR